MLLTYSFYYLDVQLEIEEKTTITKEEFKDCVHEAVKTVLGETGTCVPVDILKYYSEDNRGILRCPFSFYCKFRGALTIFGDYNGHICCFTILKSSSDLISLSCNSRNYNHLAFTPSSVS